LVAIGDEGAVFEGKDDPNKLTRGLWRRRRPVAGRAVGVGIDGGKIDLVALGAVEVLDQVFPPGP
jgi:hypothetical protein